MFGPGSVRPRVLAGELFGFYSLERSLADDPHTHPGKIMFLQEIELPKPAVTVRLGRSHWGSGNERMRRANWTALVSDATNQTDRQRNVHS